MARQHARRNGTERRSILRSRPQLEGLEGRLVLSTFNVNTTLDTVAVNLHTGKDASGHISLRSAIMAADATPGPNTINVPSGTFKLTIAGADEDAGASGDLDLKGNIKIKGAGSAVTIIDGNNLDRVLEVLSGNVTISNLTIQHGRVVGAGGGGLFNKGGTVTLNSDIIQNNQSVGVDGVDGINGSGGTSGGQGGFGTAGQGGGIFNSGTLTLSNSSLLFNQAIGGAGGNGGSGGFAAGSIGVKGGNGGTGTGGAGGAGGQGGDAIGGGIVNAGGATLTLTNDSVSNNKAIGGAGGVGGPGNIGLGGSGGASSTTEPGNGGDGIGGNGGRGGSGGRGLGGGLINLGKTTVTGNATAFLSNLAIGGAGLTGGSGANGVGGAGGNGATNGENGGNAGTGVAGRGGLGGQGGDGEGGGVFNGIGGVFTNTSILNLVNNDAIGGHGGNGGTGGFATGGRGGNGGPIQGFNVAAGGEADAGTGGAGGFSGQGQGGGLFNNTGATVTFKAPNSTSHPLSTFSGNQATGGTAGAGGNGGNAFGGRGGDGLGNLGGGAAGAGGAGVGGNGGQGGAGLNGQGGGLFNLGNATLTGVTVDFLSNNSARGGNGGNGGTPGTATGGAGGNGTHGGEGGSVVGGSGGNGGQAGSGFGGAISDRGGTLLINPRKGAPSGSAQAKATDLISGNQAQSGFFGIGRGIGIVTVGLGGTPNGPNGHVIRQGQFGTNGPAGLGQGGGVSILAPATIDNTHITGNHAQNGDDDVQGSFSS